MGDQICIKRPRRPGDQAKPRAAGPFPIIQVHTNNTVAVQRGAHVHERINIRRVRPPVRRRAN